jgi:hypothetical protein
VALARARAEDLEAHSEGGFAPLATLEVMRRDPKKMADRALVEALARDVEAFPPGRVRAEGRITLAHAFRYTFGEPERAASSYRAVVADPSGDRLTRALTMSELWAYRRQRGEIQQAAEDVAAAPDLSPNVNAAVRRALRRIQIRAGAFALLGVLAAAFVAAAARVAYRSRDLRRLPGRLVPASVVAFSLYLGGAAALLVRAHGEADPRPFLWLGIAVLVLAAGARALSAALSPKRLAARAVCAMACGVGVVAAAFLVLERADTSYLDSLGL